MAVSARFVVRWGLIQVLALWLFEPTMDAAVAQW